MNQCIRLMAAFLSVSYRRPVDEVKLTTAGFISLLGNIRSVEGLDFSIKNLIYSSFYLKILI
jgi:hypothetical protein